LAIIPIAYGYVHLAAWNTAFPTRTERLLWSSSCFYLIGCGIGFAMRVAWSQIHYIALKGASPILERMKSSKDEEPKFDLGPYPKTPIKFCSYLIIRKHVKEQLEKKVWPQCVGGLSGIIWEEIHARLGLKPGTKLTFSHLAQVRFKLSIVASIGVIYVAPRIYIVAESFLSLRYVPIGVYQTPDFNVMGLIPHI
jgi:hypothetical protein